MDAVHFLAELWGFSLIIVSLAFLVNPKNIKHVMAMAEDEKVLLLVGIINVVLGVALVLTYHVFDTSWKTTITLLGYLVLARGGIILFLPKTIKNIIAKVKENHNWIEAIFVVAVILGCVLVYLGLTL